MMKDVLITIKGIQNLDGHEEVMELTTDGRYGFKDGEALMSYDESEMMGVKGVKTLLHYKSPDTAIIKRTGTLDSKLVITKNKRSNCRYETGYGELMLELIGEDVDSDLTERGGGLTLSYLIYANNRILSRNKIEITVREVKNNVITG